MSRSGKPIQLERPTLGSKKMRLVENHVATQFVQEILAEGILEQLVAETITAHYDDSLHIHIYSHNLILALL